MVHHRLVSACVLSASGLLAQQPPLTPITPVQVNPATTAALFGVYSVAQIEMRPEGSPGAYTGRYHVTCSVQLAPSARPQLQSGVLDLGVTPSVWTPNADVAALNVPNGIHFQLSMSPDGLVVVWDIYNGASALNFPNPSMPSGTHFAFVCARPSTAVPFNPGSVMPLFVGRPTPPQNFGWTDPHLGDAAPVGGLYELFYSDATLGGPGDIVRTSVNPVTGATTPPTVVVSKPVVGVTYYHSPCDLRDSVGRVRAVTFGQNLAGAANSDILWTRNGNNTGSPYMILDGAPPTPASPTIWFSNGTTNGGTFTYGTYTTVQVDPHMVEHTLLADANLCAGESVVGFAPVRPAAGPAPSFMSWFAVSGALLPVPIPLPPPVNGLLLIDNNVLFGVIGPRAHDPYTGRVEWTFAWSRPNCLTFPMQIITMDFATLRLWLSNAANITF